MVLDRLFKRRAPREGESKLEDIRRLLEDLKGNYPYPLDEAIATEVIANALDAHPSQTSIRIDRQGKTVTFIDDGKGMSWEELEKYHNFAATTKVKGKGIGFAGLGAKLSLLVGEVFTETKTRSSSPVATRWRLESDTKAPWKEIPPKGLVSAASGTAVAISPSGPTSRLLEETFLERCVQTHFAALLDGSFRQILDPVYKKEIHFSINGKPLAPAPVPEGERKQFVVSLGRHRRPVGVGFLVKARAELPEDRRGMAISTYGKAIKRGWEWLGIAPRNPALLTGVVEVPKFVEILATNKADFEKESSSLAIFYRYRQAVQEAVRPVLRDWGEILLPERRPEPEMRPLEREVERVLEDMLPHFPELGPLLGRGRPGEPMSGVIPDQAVPPIGTVAEGVEAMTGTVGGGGEGSGIEVAQGNTPGERIEPSSEAKESGRPHVGRRRQARIMIARDDTASPEQLGHLEGNTIFVHTTHPAYRKATEGGKENYHAHLTVAWVLASHLEEGKSPLGFVSQYLLLWGRKT